MKCSQSSLAVFFLTAVAASAAEPAAPVVQETNFLQILLKGGYMMYPLGIMSIVTVLLILIFILTIRRNSVVSDRFMNASEGLIRKRDFLGLIGLCHRRNECMARVTQKTLEFITANPNASFENVREVAQVEGSHQAGMLMSRITYLADIGGIAPMVGLLGTVIGMIKAFLVIAGGTSVGVRQMNLAEGVSEALIATAGGLAISIPALVFYSIFRGRVQKLTSELEAAATHFIAILQGQIDRQSAPQPFVAPIQRPREDYAMPVASPLAGERPDLHGI